MSSTIIEEFVSHVLETSFDTLPKEVVDHAKYEIIDVIGCVIGGANAPGCLMVLDLVREWGGKKEATILVHGGRVPAQNAAMIGSIMARSYDYEVNSPYLGDKRIPSHTSATTVPTAITMAERTAASGKDLITALVLGDDIASRILVASPDSFDLGWDNTGTVTMFGTTTIASKLLGLSKRQTLNAFGIVVNHLAGAGTLQTICDGAHSFKLAQGIAARAGIFSAELASKGFTGARDALLSRYGYFPLHSREYDTEILTQELGKKFYVDRLFKPYPCCMGNHGAIDCALKLAREHDIKVEDIEQITVSVSPKVLDLFLGQPFEVREVPQVDAAFNIRYNVASALLRKEVKLEYFTEEFVREPEIMNIVSKTELRPTRLPELSLETDMNIRMKDGREFYAHMDVPKGDAIHSPLTREEIRDKFRGNVAFSKTVAEEKAEKALSMLEKLEEVDDVTKVVKLLNYSITRQTARYGAS